MPDETDEDMVTASNVTASNVTASIVTAVQDFVAARGRSLLDVFGAHSVSIETDPVRLVFYLGPESATASRLRVPEQIELARGDETVTVPCASLESPPAALQ